MTADSLRADLPGIHALGGAFDAHAADLSAVAATLRSMPSPAGALGPIGERFVAAFAASVSAHIDAVAALSTRPTRAPSAPGTLRPATTPLVSGRLHCCRGYSRARVRRRAGHAALCVA